MSRMSGRVRWMISATASAWALPGAERSVRAWPAAPRLREALNVAKRVTGEAADAPIGAATMVDRMAAALTSATLRRRVRMAGRVSTRNSFGWSSTRDGERRDPMPTASPPRQRSMNGARPIALPPPGLGAVRDPQDVHDAARRADRSARAEPPGRLEAGVAYAAVQLIPRATKDPVE